MNQRPFYAQEQETTYEIRVARHVGTAVAGHFPEFSIMLHEDGTTILRTTLPDQAALHGALARIRDLGLTLVAVTIVERSPDKGGR